MTDNSPLLRALVVYAVCLPLAIFLGYLLATPEDMSNEAVIAGVVVLLTLPLVLRWHHPMLVLSWNMIAIAFFLPGRPPLFFPLCATSLLLAILQYAVYKREQFIFVPSIAWPLFALAAVVMVTAHFTGGIGIKALGGASYGGKKYVYLLAAMAGFFALSARVLPLQHARLYVKLFFLSPMAVLIGLLANFVSPGLYFIFLVFPPDFASYLGGGGAPGGGGSDVAIERLGGEGACACSMIFCLLALYGVTGIFDFRRPWRSILFFFCAAVTLMGGFRSLVLLSMMVFGIQFYLEGLHRSRLLPVLVLVAMIVSALVLPFVGHLPAAAQRSLSFVPGLDIDPLVKQDAEGSTDWRLGMWKRVLPQVPNHLLLGAGYGIDPAALDAANFAIDNKSPGVDPFEGTMLSGDYHSGPLSLILPFGIWGVLTFCWFLYAGAKVLYQNYAYGDPRLRTINAFFLAYFVARILFYFGVFGSLYSDMCYFTGILGLSVCINGGVRVPVRAPVVRQAMGGFRLAGAAQ
jgi:hypothetical protein